MKHIENSSNSSRGEGNNITSPLVKSKQISPAIGWCFTFNNYDSSIVLKFQELIQKNCKLGFFNKEVGESGTPHLQGYIELLKKGRPLGMFPSGCHWAKAKGNKDDNFKYCSKDCDEIINMSFNFGYKIKKPIKIINDLRPWQSEIIKIIEGEPDDRKIHWIFETDGNVGKSVLTKYLVVKHKALFIDEGKKSDLVNLIYNTDMDESNLVVVDIPRDNKKISYKTLESIKNDLVCNTKYETGVMAFNSPHIVVFANFLPDITKMSHDRWDIREVVKNELVNYDIDLIDSSEV